MYPGNSVPGGVGAVIRSGGRWFRCTVKLFCFFVIREDKEFVFNFYRFLFLNGKEGKRERKAFCLETSEQRPFEYLRMQRKRFPQPPRFIKASEFFVIKSCGRRDFLWSRKMAFFQAPEPRNAKDCTTVNRRAFFYRCGGV